jgi:hypothetical protein
MEESDKKLTGAGFWMMASIAVLKDLLDLFANMSVVFVWISFFTTPFYYFLLFLYLLHKNVGVSTKKMTTSAIGFIVGIVPGFNLFPEATINLYMIRLFENSEVARRVTSIKVADN